MSKCHQCNVEMTAPPRAGDCKVCYAKNVKFCPVCAMWELGPLEGTGDVILEITTSNQPLTLEVQRQDAEKPKTAVSTVSTPAWTCDDFMKQMADLCPYIEDQVTAATATLYGEQFKAYCCRVLRAFNRLYPNCKYDKNAVRILLVMHLSSQERIQCRDIKDASAKSTSTASKNLKRWQVREIARHHLDRHKDVLEPAFQKVLFDGPPFLDALELDDVEYLLKKEKPPTLFAIDLLAKAGADADKARKMLEIATILYHCLTAARTQVEVTGHWSNAPAITSFKPHLAVGYLSVDHFKALYGDVAEAAAFTPDITALLNKVWTVLDDNRPANKLPAHPRYPDPNVDGEPLLTDAEKNFLQYLPTFDHPIADKKIRTPCEQFVRDRVRNQVKAIRNQTFRNSASVLIDQLYIEMRDHLVLDQAFDNGLAQWIIDEADKGRKVEPKGWVPLKTVNVAYSELFPQCGFRAHENIETINEHYQEITGTSARPAHYVDWRNAKDVWLYDCFPIQKTRRPVFCTLSVQPILPQPNPNYGGRILYYYRETTRNRCVFTFGDKQQPRRSMLLLLDEILVGRLKKDGDPKPQDPKTRLQVWDDLYRRHEYLNGKTYRGTTREFQWDLSLKGEKVKYPDGDFIIECQIFGGLDLARDAWGFVNQFEKLEYIVPKAADQPPSIDTLDAVKIKLAKAYGTQLALYVYIPSENANRKPVQSAGADDKRLPVIEMTIL